METYRETLFNLMNRVHSNDMISMTYEEFCNTFFYFPGGDSLRIKDFGLEFFKLHFDCYEVSWQEEQKVEKMSTKHISWLAKHCKSIYHISPKKITLFDEEEAFLFQLLDADIDSVANSGGM